MPKKIMNSPGPGLLWPRPCQHRKPSFPSPPTGRPPALRLPPCPSRPPYTISTAFPRRSMKKMPCLRCLGFGPQHQTDPCRSDDPSRFQLGPGSRYLVGLDMDIPLCRQMNITCPACKSWSRDRKAMRLCLRKSNPGIDLHVCPENRMRVCQRGKSNKMQT